MLTRIVAATGQLRLGQRLPLTSRLGVTGTGRVHTRPDRGVATTATSASDTLAALNNGHPLNNVPSSVKDLVGRDLHRQPAHPLCLIKSAIHTHMTTGATDASDTAKAGASGRPGVAFRLFDDISPVVTVTQNFDDLLTPSDHVSRRDSDTFYISDTHLLRCHTSAHQTELLRNGERAFLVAGDVYRRDAIDASHYPVFHQMEGVRIFDHTMLPPNTSSDAWVEFVEANLKSTLTGLMQALFGDVECRWVPAFFPFTNPSLELEIFFEGKWLEVLGCGVIHRDIMAACGLGTHYGYAFGLGLERLAMVLYDGRRFHEHDLFCIIRDVAGDLVENVTLVDTYKGQGRTSHCYRVVYRAMDRSLTNDEVDALQQLVRRQTARQLGVALR